MFFNIVNLLHHLYQILVILEENNVDVSCKSKMLLQMVLF